MRYALCCGDYVCLTFDTKDDAMAAFSRLARYLTVDAMDPTPGKGVWVKPLYDKNDFKKG